MRRGHVDKMTLWWSNWEDIKAWIEFLDTGGLGMMARGCRYLDIKC